MEEEETGRTGIGGVCTGKLHDFMFILLFMIVSGTPVSRETTVGVVESCMIVLVAGVALSSDAVMVAQVIRSAAVESVNIVKILLIDGLIIPSVGTCGPYPQQRGSEET